MSSPDTFTAPNLKDAVNAFERTLIHSVLVACEWNQRKAAEALGVLPTTLSEKIRRLNIARRTVKKRRASRMNKVLAPIDGRASRSLPAIEIAPQVGSWCASCRSHAAGSSVSAR